MLMMLTFPPFAPEASIRAPTTPTFAPVRLIVPPVPTLPLAATAPDSDRSLSLAIVTLPPLLPLAVILPDALTAAPVTWIVPPLYLRPPLAATRPVMLTLPPAPPLSTIAPERP